MSTPHWWKTASKDIHQIMDGFGDKVQEKLLVEPSVILRRKSPFLFRARTVNKAEEMAESVIAAYLSSSEEAMFGNTIEEIALTICKHARNGRKSGISNIDIEYDDSNTRVIVQVKSGPNWGNSSQREKLVDSFKRATAVLRQSSNLHVKAIEGISYGRSSSTDFGTHIRLIGECFWREMSKWNGTGKAILCIIGEHATNGLREPRREAVKRMVNFLRDEGVVDQYLEVDWNQLYDLITHPK